MLLPARRALPLHQHRIAYVDCSSGEARLPRTRAHPEGCQVLATTIEAIRAAMERRGGVMRGVREALLERAGDSDAAPACAAR